MDSKKRIRVFHRTFKINRAWWSYCFGWFIENQLKHLPRNIIGITRTNNVKELAEIYTSANVFFNPTLEENFPTVNLESQACGTPVISFNTGGSIETIDDTTGFIVEKGDLENTIKIIRKIKSEGKEKYSEFCIKRANKYYNKDDKFQEYIELYKSLGEEVDLWQKVK